MKVLESEFRKTNNNPVINDWLNDVALREGWDYLLIVTGDGQLFPVYCSRYYLKSKVKELENSPKHFKVTNVIKLDMTLESDYQKCVRHEKSKREDMTMDY